MPSSRAPSDRSIKRIHSIPCIDLVPKQGASKQVSWSEPTYIQYSTKEDILEHLPDWPQNLRIDSSNARDERDQILVRLGEWVRHVEGRCGCLSDEHIQYNLRAERIHRGMSGLEGRMSQTIK